MNADQKSLKTKLAGKQTIQVIKHKTCQENFCMYLIPRCLLASPNHRKYVH